MGISKHETSWLQSKGVNMLMDLGVKQGDCVMDFGCGEGRYTIPLSQVVRREGCVYAVEHDENAIAILQERLTLFLDTDNVKHITLDYSDKSQQIPDNTFDSIFVFDVLQYIDNWDLLFSYFSRILKPKGFMCIYPASIPHPGDVDIALVQSKMENTGFQYISKKQFNMMHNIDMVDDIVYLFSLKKTRDI